MEFDDMQKIWAEQSDQQLYTLDEKALLGRVQSGMSSVRRFTSISEWLLALIYLGTAAILLYQNRYKPLTNLFLLVEAVLFILIAGYVLVHHFHRAKAGRQFDRTLRGDLDHTISIARYQLRMNGLVRWSLLPIGVIMLASGWEAGKLLKVSLVMLIAWPLAFYVNSKGFRNTKKRIQALQGLKEKLGT